jgi:MFS family permease
MNYLFVFFVSFSCIMLELFWTKILNLKAWNHVVYTVIPFAILGYGIGANIQLVFGRKFKHGSSRRILAGCLLVLGAAIVLGTFALINLPIRVVDLLNIFTNFKSLGMLCLAYTIFMVPFILIGFVIVHVFANSPKESGRLYFIDLVGAGVGAAAFFCFLNSFEVVGSLLLLSFTAFVLGAYFLTRRWRWALVLAVSLIALLGLPRFAEPYDYSIDPKKGWEWIPNAFKPYEYSLLYSRWHSLGRTDIYRIKDPKARKEMEMGGNITFQLNLNPVPEFSYFTTNFLSGTPVFRYPELKGNTLPKEVELFSQTVELPYVLVKAPKVLVIGTGGGRDIFMAKTHGATEIVGAEINPETTRAMSKGGVMYDYSGHVYDLARVQAIDGRHLVKVAPKNHFDLIVLNGVDTFSGLSSGAYAYAESYLYTKEAIIDYLRALDENGIVNFNRWLFKTPRETLRLEAIALDALTSLGVKNPWDHLVILEQASWSMVLIKKSPFTDEDMKRIVEYAHSHVMILLFPSERDVRITSNDYKFFDAYARSYRKGLNKIFVRNYPYDVSVVTDDRPFFYKYYKFKPEELFRSYSTHHTGTVVFWTQFLVLLQALIFILLFIIGPLVFSKAMDLRKIPVGKALPFIIYFACLGVGYMFVEIPLMQKFVLLLGTPICSISVVLAALLVWTGVGSLLLSGLQRPGKFGDLDIIQIAALVVMILTLLLVTLGTSVLDLAVGWGFSARIILVILLLAPAGIFLGAFFPTGLKIASGYGPSATAWAWAINCGFSVLGSILAIILAQFMGFKAVLLLAVLIYLVATLAFRQLVDE